MKNTRHAKRARALATKNSMPTMTDQSQADDTNVNVIVKKMSITGPRTGPGNAQYGDYSTLPSHLRGWIELGRSLDTNRQQLPPQLQNLPLTDLLTLSPDQIDAILNPPKPADPENKETKA